MPEYHFYEPRLGHRLPHSPFKSIIAPRPIGWISTIDTEGRVNLAPYSFFNAFSEDPPIIGFSSHGRKDSQQNIEATGEFVFNIATRTHAAAMNETSAAAPHGVNEMELAGLASTPSKLVRPPRVADVPAAMECKLLRMIPLDDLDQNPTGNTLILGQVVAVHIDTAYLNNGRFDIAMAGTIARCGYSADYTEVTELFEMTRPKGRRD